MRIATAEVGISVGRHHRRRMLHDADDVLLAHGVEDVSAPACSTIQSVVSAACAIVGSRPR
jgi:hypothetical protein